MVLYVVRLRRFSLTILERRTGKLADRLRYQHEIADASGWFDRYSGQALGLLSLQQLIETDWAKMFCIGKRSYQQGQEAARPQGRIK